MIRYDKNEILNMYLQEAMLKCLQKELERGKPLLEEEVKKLYKTAASAAEATGRPWKPVPIGIVVFLGSALGVILLGTIVGMLK